MPTLSYIIGTARASYNSLIGLNEHYMERTFKSFEAQTDKDFEVIISDALYSTRDLTSEIKVLATKNNLKEWSFPWRVVPVFSWWLKEGLWALQRGFNTGAVYSEGDNFVFCGDCCEWPTNAVKKAKFWLKKGFQPSYLCVYKRGGEIQRVEQAENALVGGGSTSLTVKQLQDMGVFGDSNIVRDSRWKFVEESGGIRLDGPWSWAFGYITIPRTIFYDLNGYDENFDGDKSLGDCEIGSRMEMAGLWKPVLDGGMLVYENSHCGVDETVLFKKLRAIRSNYDLIYVLRARRQTIANNYHLSKEEFNKIVKETKYCNIYNESDEEWKYQLRLLENPSMFDLNDKWRLTDENYAY